MKTFKKNQFILYLILLCFLLIKIFHLLFQKGIFWDSAVYIGMGKYIFSFGKIGLWEPSRPLVWSIFLGILWKLKLDPIISGRILELIFSLGCICLTYLIGKEIFDEKIALLSAFFLACSPTFLFYSTTILTGIPSTFFSLLAIYFFVKDKSVLAGLFIGLSFMSRFLQFLILIPIISAIFFCNKKRLNKIINLFYGFSVITIPYLILNLLFYKNPIYPFLLQLFMTQNTGWIFNQPLVFYFINLFKENFLILFAIVGIIAILTKKNYKKTTIMSIFLLFFIFFSSISHKEIRFIIVLLPYTYLITSYGIFKSLKLVKKKKNISYLTIITLSFILIFQIIPQIKIPALKEYPEFNTYLKNEDVKENVWISNPIFIVNSNKKADELIYYPLYNSKKIDILKERLREANHILIDTCDILPCPPNDKECYNKTNDFLNTIKKEFKMFYYKKEGDCEQFIFTINSLS